LFLPVLSLFLFSTCVFLFLFSWHVTDIHQSFHSSEPGLPPSNIIGRNLSTSSLETSWSPPPETSLNGILSGYAISVHRYNGESLVNAPVQFIYTCAFNTSKLVKNLYIGLKYCVKVAAFTRMGLGNYSNCLVVKLNEDGKYCSEHSKAVAAFQGRI
jgi:hypothetical protein